MVVHSQYNQMALKLWKQRFGSYQERWNILGRGHFRSNSQGWVILAVLRDSSIVFSGNRCLKHNGLLGLA